MGKSRDCPSTLSELNQKIAAQIDGWRGEIKNVSIPVAVGVNVEG